MAKELSERQNKFISAMLKEDVTPPQAAIAAGYSNSNAQQAASRLMKNKLVLEALAKARRDRAARTGIGEDYVLARLRDIVEREDATDANVIRALELIGRHLGLWDKAGKTEDKKIEVQVAQEAEEWSV